MTEKRFRKVLGLIKDSNGDLLDLTEIADKMNQLNNENKELKEEKKELQCQCNLLREQKNEFHRIALENANRVGQLEKENGKLKKELKRLKCINKQLEDRLDRDIALNMNCGDVE